MKILVDEKTIEGLRERWHDVRDVRGTQDQGLTDQDLWAAGMDGKALAHHYGPGFTEYRWIEHAGILIVRLRQPNRHRIHQAVILALQAVSGIGVARIAGCRTGGHAECVANGRPG